jgi:hypothetical protein
MVGSADGMQIAITVSLLQLLIAMADQVKR